MSGPLEQRLIGALSHLKPDGVHQQAAAWSKEGVALRDAARKVRTGADRLMDDGLLGDQSRIAAHQSLLNFHESLDDRREVVAGTATLLRQAAGHMETAQLRYADLGDAPQAPSPFTADPADDDEAKIKKRRKHDETVRSYERAAGDRELKADTIYRNLETNLANIDAKLRVLHELPGDLPTGGRKGTGGRERREFRPVSRVGLARVDGWWSGDVGTRPDDSGPRDDPGRDPIVTTYPENPGNPVTNHPGGLVTPEGPGLTPAPGVGTTVNDVGNATPSGPGTPGSPGAPGAPGSPGAMAPGAIPGAPGALPAPSRLPGALPTAAGPGALASGSLAAGAAKAGAGGAAGVRSMAGAGAVAGGGGRGGGGRKRRRAGRRAGGLFESEGEWIEDQESSQGILR